MNRLITILAVTTMLSPPAYALGPDWLQSVMTFGNQRLVAVPFRGADDENRGFEATEVVEAAPEPTTPDEPDEGEEPDENDDNGDGGDGGDGSDGDDTDD